MYVQFTEMTSHRLLVYEVKGLTALCSSISSLSSFIRKLSAFRLKLGNINSLVTVNLDIFGFSPFSGLFLTSNLLSQRCCPLLCSAVMPYFLGVRSLCHQLQEAAGGRGRIGRVVAAIFEPHRQNQGYHIALFILNHNWRKLQGPDWFCLQPWKPETKLFPGLLCPEMSVTVYNHLALREFSGE